MAGRGQRRSRRTRPKRHKERDPAQALSFLRQFLNNKNLAQLLRLCAGLSGYDHFSPFQEEWALKGFINYPHNRALLFGLLGSNAAIDAPSTLSRNQLIKALNSARDASYDPDALKPAKDLSGKAGVELELHRFFSRIGNIQIAHREHNPLAAAGRTVAMLQVLPDSKMEWLSGEMLKIKHELSEEFEAILGSSVRNLALAHGVLLLHCRRNFDQMLGSLPSAAATDEERLLRLLDLVIVLADTREPFGFSTSDIVSRNREHVAEADFQSLIRVFGKDFEALRALLDTAPYRRGHISASLSPLDRYPIVRVSKAENIIPSVSQFVKSFAHVIDYTLLEELGKRNMEAKYAAFRGAMQEIYLRALVEDCLEGHICIPETTYGKEHKKGPDLTIIDLISGRLIAVESKSRRMRADTVTLMSDKALDQNLSDAFEALVKLPKKIGALYSGLLEYKSVQTGIDKTRNSAPIGVIVLSNSVFSLSEILRLRAKGNPEDPLHAHPHPYCVVSVETFERAVEIARVRGVGLGTLFAEHSDVSGTFDPATPIADAFAGRPLSPTHRYYAERFLSR